MNEQKPTVGRIVHYQSHGSPNGQHQSLPRAAVITEVHYEPRSEEEEPKVSIVGLCVLNPTGQYFDRDVPYSAEPKPGHWSWPPRV